MYISRTGGGPTTEKKLMLAGQPIDWTSTRKYLGLMLDKSLSFTPHIIEKIKKAKAAKAALYPILGKRSKLSTKNKLLIYTQYFLAAIMYASPIWITINKTAKRKLISFQNSFIKSIFRIPWYVERNLIMQELGIPTIQEKLLNTSLNFYEKIDNIDNPLIKGMIIYPLNTNRKRPRPRDPGICNKQDY